MMTLLVKQFAASWSKLGEQMQAAWNDFLAIVGDDPLHLWVYGSSILVIAVYWLYASFFTVIDITQRPKFLRKYKIQPGQNEPVDLQKLWKAIQVVLFNQTVVGVPISYIIYKFAYRDDHIRTISELPDLSHLIMQFAVFVLLEEFIFYYAHRLLHHRLIYKHIHKKHHEWMAPIAVINFYCHPVEHIVSNLLPVGVAVALLQCHILTAWIIISAAIFKSMTDHTGYSFPWSPDSVRFHDYHHAKFNYNFGVFGWLDKLHGTYRESVKNANAGKARRYRKRKHK